MEKTRLPEDIKRNAAEQGKDIDDETATAIFSTTVVLPALIKYRKEHGKDPRFFNAHIELASDILRMCDRNGRDYVICGQPGEKVFTQRDIKLFGMGIKAELEEPGTWQFEE